MNCPEGGKRAGSSSPGEPKPVETERHPLWRSENGERVGVHSLRIHDVELSCEITWVESVRQEVAIVLVNAAIPRHKDALAAPTAIKEIVALAATCLQVVLDAAADGVARCPQSSEDGGPHVATPHAGPLWMDHWKLHVRAVQRPLLHP